MRHLNVIVVFAAVVATYPLAGAQAQTAGSYPTRALRIVVPLAAGGNLDVVARAVAQQLGENLGQQVIVENRPGSSSLVGTQLVAKSAADGYTLLAIANTFVTVPLVVLNPGYDPLKDFAAISLTCLVPQALVVNPALPVRSVKELIALGRSQPGALSYASSGAGGIGYFASTLFNSQAGVKMLHVPYKGNSQAIIDVIGGQVAMMFDQVSTSVPYIKAGKLRALGVSSLKRSPLLPDLPTIDESGLSGYESITFNGLVAPAATPRAILNRLHEETAKVVRHAELRKRYLDRGVELVASVSPEAFAAYMKAEIEKTGKLAREAGIKPE
ncbi:MAG: tripartite tricarboxylate transporter substrate binding protein [Burkholderiales bacterium]